MTTIRLEQLGIAVKEKRGNRGLREVASEIGTSAATLSRIEAGKQPDLETFSKICKWLDINPAEILNFNPAKSSNSNDINNQQTFAVQFRAEKTLTPETAKRLGELIMAVQNNIANESNR